MGNFGSALSRRMVLGGLVGAGATALAGCSDGGDTTSSGDAESGVLNVWGGVPAESGPSDLIAAFQKEHPGIKVTYTRYVNDDPGNLKLDNSLQGGVPIDLFFSFGSGRISKRVKAGLTLDITEKVKADPKLAMFTADAEPQANYVFDGKIYTVPCALSPAMVLVNADALDQAGVEIPDGWDMNDYHEIAKKVSKKNVYGSFSTPLLARETLGPDYFYATDGASTQFDNPAFRKEVELAKAMQADGSAMPQKVILAEKLRTFAQSAFLSGRCLMVPTQAFLLRYVSDTKEYPHNFKVRCLAPPAPVKGQEFWNPGAYGDLLSISKKSTQQDAAWTFFTFWVTNAGKYMTKGGRLPSLMDPSQADDIIGKLLGPQAEKLFDVPSFKPVLFDDKMKVPVDTIYTGATEIDDLLQKTTDEVLLGDITVDQWVTQMKSEADAAVKKG